MSKAKLVDSIISSKEVPSGGTFNQFCKNSALFTDRKCKTDGKLYDDGQICPCFMENSSNRKPKS